MIRIAAALVAVLCGAGVLPAQLKVVTSTTDLASIAKSVGGSRVTVSHVSEGYQDPHFAEAKPSFLLRMRDADVFAFVGLDLEIGWMPLLVDGARNPKIRPGGTGHVDVSAAIQVLDAQRNADRSQGDVHPLGNPHYWLDPDNGRKIARLFDRKFSELAPSRSAEFSKNRQEFETRLNAAEKGWQDELAVIKGKPVVAFHTSWKYLAEYTGMKIVGFMEPKPGVPPSPSHLAGLILQIRRTGAKAIIMEPFYSRKDADFVASKTGAKVLVLPPSVGAIRGAPVNDYVSLMQYNLRLLAATLK
ncbi:MAG TPA: metal ABC transporter substrate-binding protein [Gemmatimonadaceae bacterium]|nr:metal ABC transporter substrate-binding protein [Gemmatimonadaceae bacterium]